MIVCQKYLTLTNIPDRVMPTLSHYEKSAIGSLVILLALSGWYFSRVLSLWERGDADPTAIASLSVAAVTGLVVLHIIYHAIIAWIDHRDLESDERDRSIELRADSLSGHVLGIGVVHVILAIGFGSMVAHPLLEIYSSPFVLAHMLLATLVVSELTKLTLQIYYYRRGY